MSDMTPDGDVALCELDEALKNAVVLAEEYAGYDEYAARRRIARRIVADRSRSVAAGHGSVGLPLPGQQVPAAGDHLVLDAACHVRAARGLDEMAWTLVESRAFAELALGAGTWPHGMESALLFAGLLHLSGKPDGAQFWFQYAAGAGSRAAAQALYLHHLARAEVKTARHWQDQAQTLPPDEDLPHLPQTPEALEEALGASVIWTSPPITTQDLAALMAPGRSAQRPHYRLPARLGRAATSEREEDDDLGEVFLPGPQTAVAVARYARLNPKELTEEANPWALEALKPPQLTRAARSSPEERPAQVAMESVHRTLRVLEVISRYSGGVSMTQIARETHLPQLALVRAMEALIRSNLATPAGPGAYIAGHALLLTGGGDGGGRRQVGETLAWVRDAVGAAVYVARYTEGEVSITQYADSPAAPVVEEWVDFRAAAHASAVGKALLIQLDYNARKDHLSRHQPVRFTPHTLTSQETLFDQLDTCHPNAPLLDLQEYALGTVCAAVPIASGPNPECVALSMPVPDPRRLRQAARILQSEATAVLLALIVAGSSDPTPRRDIPGCHDGREGEAGTAGCGSGALSTTW